MRRFWILIYLINCLSVAIYGQIHLSGKITDKDCTPLTHAVVVVKDKNSGIIRKNTLSLSDGTFRLSIEKEMAPKVNLHILLMGYKEQIFQITDKEEQVFTIQMEVSEVKIKEVVIKAKKMWERGDTLVYNVSSFASSNDRTIGDIIKKLPGFNVKKDGEVLYNGKPINKFYIEGKDLLEGKYGIATNGIPQTEVGRVEVLENHQPIRALDGVIFSDNAAVNLKLKDRAKAHWITTLQGGAGAIQAPWKPIWEAKATAFMFKQNFQNILKIGSNNIGENYSSDLISHYNSYITVSDNFFSPRSFFAPNLETERTLFNKSHFFSTNALWSIGKTSEIKTQLHYLNHRENWDSQLSTTYFLPTGEKVIQETEDGHTKAHLLAAAITYESNVTSAYLKNILKSDVHWAGIDVHTNGNYPNTQTAQMPNVKINNQLQWTKRLAKSTFTFNSINEFSSSPQHLTICRDDAYYKQTANRKRFHTYQEAVLGWFSQNFTINTKIGMTGQVVRLNSHLENPPSMPYSFMNEIRNSYLHLFATPELQFTHKKWRFSATLPINYYLYHFSGTEGKKHDVKLSPSFRVFWNYSGNMTYFLNYNMNFRPYNLVNHYSGLLLRNYRTFYQGSHEYATGYQNSITVGYDYKNMSSGWFSNSSLMYLKSKNPFRESMLFYDDFRIHTSIHQPVYAHSMLCNASVSKSTDLINGLISIDLSYLRAKSSLISENQPLSYRTQFLIANLTLNGDISSYFNWLYKLSYKAQTLKVGVSDSHRIDDWQQSLSLNINPTKKLRVEFSGEHYHNEIMDRKYKSFVVLNSKISYTPSKKIELSLNIHNLLNHNQYDITSHNSLSEIKQSYSIRGRELWISFLWK
ncbi:MAG: TonB-dependent receptor [Phocaeicola sp.]|nr:TonB-dependent receptor [Prevotellaceae bacterium]MDY5938483.1 TonB-dependent receptor [Phocaeicola sp.]